MAVQVTPIISIGEVGVRQQGRTVVKAVDTTQVTLTIADVMNDRDDREKLYMIFNCKSNYYVNTRGDATAPAADVVTGKAPLLNPESLVIPGNVTAITLAAESADYLHIEIFKLKN